MSADTRMASVAIRYSTHHTYLFLPPYAPKKATQDLRGIGARWQPSAKRWELSRAEAEGAKFAGWLTQWARDWSYGPLEGG